MLQHVGEHGAIQRGTKENWSVLETKMKISFLHCHCSSQIFKTLQNPFNYLAVSSFKITKTKRFRPPNLAISLIMTFVSTEAHTSLFNTLCIVIL